MFQCSRFSLSAPTDSLGESSSLSKNRSEDWSPHDSAARVAYVSEDDDLGKTGVVIQFHRSIKSDNPEIEARRRSAIDKGFMRFGRSRNMVRFGRSNPDTLQYTADNDGNDNDLERNDNEINEPFPMRMRKGNMMRFGRGYKAPQQENDDDYYNNDASEIYDFVATPVRRNPDNKYDEHGKKILRLGRSSSESYSDENLDIPQQSSQKDRTNEREKKPIDGNVLRFGRAEKAGNLLRFGRGNMMRFGRGNMMRFGKRNQLSINDNNDDFMRSIRAGGNVMRFGRSEKNLMRFGKRTPKILSSKFYCGDDNCLIQEKENRLLDNTDNDGNPSMNNYEQLNSLFGDDGAKQQGYGEYIIAK